MSNVKTYLKKLDIKLSKKYPEPFTSGYCPELDITPDLDSKRAAYYQSLIGIVLFIVELGRVDITVKTSVMDSCMAMPCCGHMEKLFHIFKFLFNKHNTEMLLELSDPEIDQACFEQDN